MLGIGMSVDDVTRCTGLLREQYLDVLKFDYELPLTTDPLRIDVVVVKKEPAEPGG
ncbi:MAG: hypothetical protein LBR38_08200 [Synergistaceae bacterium]|jgi:hypothetical protein|nr:hypothetical protein [Synergistaceae bacterium]